MHRHFGRMIKLLSFILSATVVITATGIPLYAQDQNVPQPGQRVPAVPQPQPFPAPQTIQPPAPPQPIPQPQHVQPPVLGQRPAGQLAVMKRGDISFNFDDADIFEVIQTVFGDIMKVNYMVDPRVKGRITFRTVTPIPKDDVLSLMEILLKMNGAGFVEENGLYRILPADDIPGTTPQVFVYALQNSKATHIAQLLQSIFAGGGGSAAPPVPQPSQVSTTPKTGGSAFSLGAGHLVGPSTKLLADEITNSLIVLATPDDYKLIEETIKKIDTTPRQVMIEVLVAEVDLTDEFQFGIEWVLQNAMTAHINPFKRDITLAGPIGQNSNLLPTGANLASGFSGFSWAFQDAAGNVKALLQTLSSQDKVNVLASPHILAADNREARIQIGSQVPIATSQATAVGTSNSILSTIQYKDIGTILKVKPQINESGLVALEVSQEVSSFSTQTVLGTDQVVIKKSEATTNLMAQDGQTVVIGGLIQDSLDKNRSGIPFLSQIPVLGYLFGSTKNTLTKTEIIVLLTPHVIRNQEDAGSMTTDYINRIKTNNKDLNINKYAIPPSKSSQEPK